MTTTRPLRALLAVTAASAVLLTGCGDRTGDSSTDRTGDVPGTAELADATPSESATPPADHSPADPPADHSPADDDLSEVPLAAGWPEEVNEPGSAGLELPVAELSAPFDAYACDDAAPAPAGSIASLRGQFSDVEAYLARELLTFEDADAAVAFVSSLSRHYATCTRTPEGDDGLTYPLRTVATDVGGQSFAVVRGAEYEGEPAIGMSALHVVRVGRSVLLDTTSGEGLVRDERDARDLADSMGDRSADVVAAMCAFTEKGC